jgi:DNA-binding response OmpR family regulator
MNKTITILYVEDEMNLAGIIRESLEVRQFQVVHVPTAREGLASFTRQPASLVILDVMLPDGDGFELARQLRKLDRDVPIIFLTAKLLPQDVVLGFESGGNDYLKKPFSLEELVIRIRVLLNKNRSLYLEEPGDTRIIRIGDYQLHPAACKLYYAGLLQPLTARESELLSILALNLNSVVDRSVLLTKIWGNNDYFSGRSLDVFISKLRKYLRHDQRILLLNVRGIGYKLVSSEVS